MPDAVHAAVPGPPRPPPERAVVNTAAAPRARVLTDSDYRHRRWRNGGGSTLEIAREPPGDEPDFDWRVSVAEVVVDGPFSPFPGCERTSVMLEGGPLRLRFASGAERRLEQPLQGCRFDGAEVIDGTLAPGAKARMFNVICRSDRWQAEVVPFAAGGESIRHLPAGETLLVWCMAGDLDLDLRPPGEGWSLLAGECLLVEGLDGQTVVTLHDQGGEAVAVLVELVRIS